MPSVAGRLVALFSLVTGTALDISVWALMHSKTINYHKSLFSRPLPVNLFGNSCW